MMRRAPNVAVQRVRRSQMNLSTVGAGARTVGAFVLAINEEADPAGHCYYSRPCLRASADAISEMGLR